MLEVPHHLISTARFLLDELADRFIHEPLPPPGVPIPVGGESPDEFLWVVVQPWELAARFLPAGAPGQREHRALFLDSSAIAVSAAVCAAQPQGAFARAWTCPIGVLERIRTGAISILQSDLAMKRREVLAQYGWPELALAFQDARRARPSQEPLPARFFVQTSLPIDAASGQFESITLEIDEIEGDRAVGALLHDARCNPHFRQGHRIEVRCEKVTDWFVETPMGRIGSQHRRALRSAMTAIAAR